MSASLAALRIARRDALRAKGRSALVMIMIGLPVLVFSSLITFGATVEVSEREKLPIRMGIADGHLKTTAYSTPIRQGMAGYFQVSNPPVESPGEPWTAARVAALLGGRVIPYDEGSVIFQGPRGHDQVSAFEVDLRDPLTRGMRRLADGRLPAASSEVAASLEMRARGIRIGDVLTLTRMEGRQVRVVGFLEHPTQPGRAELFALPGTLLADKANGRGTGFLVDTPRPLAWADVRKANAVGLLLGSRAVIEDPPDEAALAGHGGSDTTVDLALAVFFIVVETVLLAGPAFAVGLRRRRRELAVIAAQGGSRAHLRAIVLADGLVLGGSAAVVGAVAGVALTVAGLPLWSGWSSEVGPVEVPVGYIAAVALLGVVSGVVAALVPAVQAARQNTVQVLAGRRGETRDRPGRPLLGALLVAAGVVVVTVGTARSLQWILAGAALGLLGLVALMPWLVRRAGRVGAWLPLPLRLSVRDAARHRIRTASACAAVMAATAGAMAAGITGASVYADRMAGERPTVPFGSMRVHGDGLLGERGWTEMKAAAQRRLPGVELVPSLAVMDGKGQTVGLGVRSTREFPSYLGVLVGDERLLRFALGRSDAAAEAALAAGKAVVFDPAQVRDGMVTLTFNPFTEGGKPVERRVPAVPALPADARQGGAVISASAVSAAGFTTVERYLHAAHIPPDVNVLERELSAVSGIVWVEVQEDLDRTTALLLSTILAGALVLVFGGTFAATGLAAADMRGDLDTMSAIGAPPRARRLVVAGQAGFIAGLGALVGVIAGGVLGVALAWMYTGRTGPGPVIRPDRGSFSIPGEAVVSIPWGFAAALLLALPLLAALLAGSLTRTRLALARRPA